MKRLNCISFKHLGKTLIFVGVIVFFCEVLIYYFTLLQCTWPQMSSGDKYSTVRAMILSDPHLLGPKYGHWFDKLRREWQMYRTFQTSMVLHNPDVVFILGDVFDEGFHCTDEEFNKYVKRFHSLFSVPETTKLYVVIGNHDVGFHYRITMKQEQRFEKAFNMSSVEFITIRSNTFVLVNSMALHGDNCILCRAAEEKIADIAKELNCARTSYKTDECKDMQKLNTYTQPIYLQHFPLYRKSDSECQEPDAAPPNIRSQPFRENWECLSQTATDKVLDLLDPRVAFTGHTHHGCFTVHRELIPEWTVSSFSWRNKNNPSFILATFNPIAFSIDKCLMPNEDTVVTLYIISGIVLFAWIYNTRRKFFRGITIKDKL